MLLTQEEYDKRLYELQEIKIVLDSDPVATVGLAGINQKIAELQGQRDRVNALLVEAIKNRADADILWERKKAEYDREIARLLSSDQEVQNQKSEKARQAMADTKLYQLVLTVHHVELEYKAADAYYKAVQQVYTNLESTNMNLSRQISVIQMGIQIGEIQSDVANSLYGKKLTLKKQGE